MDARRGLTLIELPAMRKGFTLIELLVVVTIIIALLAILLPSMSRAVEVAHRAVCGSQLHQWQASHLAFAADHLRELPVGQAATGDLGAGIHIVWANGMSTHDSFKPYGQYRGLGYLIKSGYHDDNDGKTLYCPSWTHERMRIGGDRGWPTSGDLVHLAPGQVNIGSSYSYRSTFNAPQFRSARLAHEPGRAAIIVDSFAGVGWGDVSFHHFDGYNVAAIDGSASWFSDPEYLIRDYNAGASYNNDLSGYSLQEEVFTEFFDRR